MKNKITKFLTILSIIFISFFINQNKAEATECEYILIPPYINENSIATKLQIQWTYYGNTTDTTIAKIDYFLLKCNSEKGKCDFGIQTDDTLSGLSNPYYSTKNIKYDNLCSDYVRLDVNWNGKTKNSVKVYDAQVFKSNASLYKSGLDKVYKNKVPNNSLYGLITIKADSFVNGIHEGLMDYIIDVDGLVFVNKKKSSNYPKTRLNEFKSKLEEKGYGEDFSKFPIDQSTKNEKTYTKDYYDATKTKWHNYMNKYINNSDKRADTTRKEYFQYWWDNVNRYVFEEDLELFKKYFVYLYEGMTPEYANQPGTMPEDRYNHYLEAINAMIEYEDYSDDEDCLTSDPCSSLCNTSASNYICSGPSYTQCTSHSQQYQSCKNAYNSCKNVPASNYDSCMSSRMGVEAYNSLKEKNSSIRDELQKMQDDAINRIADSLHSIKAPSLDVDFKPYEVTCDDVAIFHTFYVILEIMAPILVILFGTIDYAKAVMASDVEKMQKAKKNFPKRLGLLLLFIFVPLIVSFLIGEFSSTNSSLMYCIINGG